MRSEEGEACIPLVRHSCEGRNPARPPQVGFSWQTIFRAFGTPICAWIPAKGAAEVRNDEVVVCVKE
ncbi:hypothetical protein GCM10010970_32360 [Silvimonas iriomotensis]|uniref:Uncharacterized protein n=1 Tax=Silvimonas iriomotensis TaxID=449662 RepID=A0ABQ2PD99_9NEIS|nr:hypothetical protein GCM10010970_32360 [Silvimonas iriomotensis]